MLLNKLGIPIIINTYTDILGTMARKDQQYKTKKEKANTFESLLPPSPPNPLSPTPSPTRIRSSGNTDASKIEVKKSAMISDFSSK